MVVMGNCCMSTPPVNTEKTGFNGDRILTIATSAGNNVGLNKKDTNRTHSTRVSDLHHKESDNEGYVYVSLNRCFSFNNSQKHRTITMYN